MKNLQPKKLSAFTLLELSLVIIVVSLLIASTLSVSRTALNNNKEKITKERLEKIYQAIGRYLQEYDRIPCPASMQLAKSNANYGVEVACNYSLSSAIGIWQSPWNASVVYGAVPVKELGLEDDMAEDGYGSKIVYVMLKGFSDQENFTKIINDTVINNGAGNYWDAGDGQSVLSRIRIHQSKSGTVNRITSEAILVLMSYGKNKFCAFNANATSQNSSSSDTHETFNCISSLDSPNAGRATFYNYNYSSNLFPFMAKSDNESFDDILLFKTTRNLMTDFNYYQTPPCSENISEVVNVGGTDYTFYWEGDSSLNEENSGVSTIACPSGYNSSPYAGPLKKCGENKRWRKGLAVECVAD